MIRSQVDLEAGFIGVPQMAAEVPVSAVRSGYLDFGQMKILMVTELLLPLVGHPSIGRCNQSRSSFFSVDLKNKAHVPSMHVIPVTHAVG